MKAISGAELDVFPAIDDADGDKKLDAKEDAKQDGKQKDEKKDDNRSGGGSDSESDNREGLDPFRFAKKHFPTIKLLRPGTFDKRFPYQCTVCVSKKHPHGRVGELSRACHKDVKHFLKQHLTSPTHLRNVEKQNKMMACEEDKVECKGLCVSDISCAGRLSEFRVEFDQWARHSNLKEFAKHTYWFDANENSWFVRSCHCETMLPQPGLNERPVCKQCKDLNKPHSIIRAVERHAIKFFSAELLTARLFHGEAAVMDLTKFIEGSALYFRRKNAVTRLMQCSNGRLQQLVRESFTSDGKPSEVQQRFMATVVDPALAVAIGSVPERLQDVTSRIAAVIAGGQGDEAELSNMKLALASLKGSFNTHPMVQGLMLQCFQLVDRQERGIYTMKGRRNLQTDHERAAINDAGLQFAVLAGNSTLMKTFGLNPRASKTQVDDLAKFSLPQSPLAFLWPETLRKNFQICDQRFLKALSTPRRYLDHTDGWVWLGSVSFIYVQRCSKSFDEYRSIDIQNHSNPKSLMNLI